MIQVFGKQWFTKYNKQLCWLANSFLGQFVFKFKKYGHYTKNKIVKMTPNSVGELLGSERNKVEIKEHFFSRNEYALRLQKVFYPIWFTFHCWDMLIANRFKPAWNLGFDTLTVYPDAGTGNTTVDGPVYHDYGFGNGFSWSTLVAAAGSGQSATINYDYAVQIIANTTSNEWRWNKRSIFLFDTSGLTADATISATVMSLYGNGKSDGLSVTPDIDIYTSTPASDNALVNGDYAQVGSTSQTGSPNTYASWGTSVYNDFTLDATGRGNVSKTGISKFGARNANYDVSGTPPTWSSGNTSRLDMQFADAGSNKPKLVVTYSAAAADTGNFLQLF